MNYFVTFLLLISCVCVLGQTNLLGCKFSKMVCLEDEICYDDNLFGLCQSRSSSSYDDYKYDLSPETQFDLGRILQELLRENYHWTDLYTQCKILNFLLSVRFDVEYDDSLCDRTNDFQKKDQLLNIHKYLKNKRNEPNDDINIPDSLWLDSPVERRDSFLENQLMEDALIKKPEKKYFDNDSRQKNSIDNDRLQLNRLNYVMEKLFAEMKPKSLTEEPISRNKEWLNEKLLEQKITSLDSKRMDAENMKITEVEKNPKDHGFDNPNPHNDIIEKPKYTTVDKNTFWIRLKPTPKVNQIEWIKREILKIFPELSDLNVLNEVDGKINFRINANSEIDGSQLASKLGDRSKKNHFRNSTGFEIVESGYGYGNEVKISAISQAKLHENKYFIISFIIIGTIAGMIIFVIIFYIVRRHSRKFEKIKDLTKPNQSDKDYEELCRQRMQVKSSEKAEPISATFREKQDESPNKPESRSSTSSWNEEPVQSNMDITTGHVVLSYMEDHLKNKEKLDEEWNSLCNYEAEPNSCKIAMENERHNRFCDILPYDHARVILNSSSNASGIDYINASCITDHDPRNPAFIATQGPLQNTVSDFWQMVWEQGAVTIVNLTKIGDTLCHRYWPEEGVDLYHTYEVHLVSEHIWSDDYVVRSFYLKNIQTNETRTVSQFHFLTWNQLGVPNSIKAILDFRRKVNKSYKARSCPIVVHCSDGAGRAGTYCLLDLVLNRLAKGAKEIDIAASLEHIRDQRMSMVKTKEQFTFVLSAVAEEVHAILKALSQ